MRQGKVATCFPVPKTHHLETRGGWERNVLAPDATAPLTRYPVELFPATALPLSLFRSTIYGTGAGGGGACVLPSRRQRRMCPPPLAAHDGKEQHPTVGDLVGGDGGVVGGGVGATGAASWRGGAKVGGYTRELVRQ